MSTAETPGPLGFDVVIAPDGSIPAGELARLGLTPGMHLRLLPGVDENLRPRKKVKGILRGKFDVDDFEAAMAQAKEERVAEVMRESDEK